MALSYKNDHDQDERLNPASRDRVAGDLHEREQQAAYDRDFDAIANHPDNRDLAQAGKSIDDKEQRPDSPWANKVKGLGSQKLSPLGKLSQLTKRKGPMGVVAGLLIAMIFGVSTFLPFNMLPHLMQNITSFNDSSSTAMERRFVKAFSFMNREVDPADPLCASQKLKCKTMGRISNSALRKLDHKGVRACFDGDCSKAHTRRTGYPDRNPTSYLFTVDGQSREVPVSDLEKFLLAKENRKFATKVYGVKGAFNMRVKAWTGKHVTSRFWNPFGLKRDGGLADGKNRTANLTPDERIRATYAKLSERIPAVSALESRAAGAKTKMTSQLNRAKKGGVQYMLAVAGCIAPKVPRYVAAGVAAVQLAQIMPAVQETILSPGAKVQASGLDETYRLSAEDVETTSTVLTERTPRASDGKLSSALDSKYLMAAAGFNHGKPPVSKDFTPGYAVLTSQTIQRSAKLEQLTKSSCDVVLHPATMYSAMAADTAVTILASTTIVLGVVKVAAGFAATQLVAWALGGVAEAATEKAIMELATNDKIPTARGEELGDIIGIGGAAFFAAGGMSRHLPTLTKTQLAEYEAVRQENELAWRDMTVAELSPWDTSSRYTFLGSILYNFNATLMNREHTVSKLFAFLPNPISLMNASASANQPFTETYCSYADDFAVSDVYGDSDASADVAARNMAGLPCTGILPEQVRMATGTAIDLMLETENWIDGTKDIPEGATIGTLIQEGIIKKDNPLVDFITMCSDASTGDYLFNSDSCTVRGTTGDPDFRCVTATNEEDESVEVCPEPETADLKGIRDPRSTIAMTPFLIDFQIIQSINGEDDE